MKKILTRRRVSPSMAVAIFALVLALGAGAAYAKSHFIITQTSQIKPSVLKKLHGAKGSRGLDGTNGINGSNGATGPAGATGATGTAGQEGDTGPQGPGAEILEGTINAGQTSSAVGTIPVQLDCVDGGAYPNVPNAVLQTTDTTGSSSFPVESFGGNYYTTETYGANGANGTTPLYSAAFGSSSPTALNSGGIGASGIFGVGTILLTHYTRILLHTFETTETVTYDVEVEGASGTDGTCSFAAQIVPSS
jgi:Collagen triple helix repeat (20 copies)